MGGSLRLVSEHGVLAPKRVGRAIIRLASGPVKKPALLSTTSWEDGACSSGRGLAGSGLALFQPLEACSDRFGRKSM